MTSESVFQSQCFEMKSPKTVDLDECMILIESAWAKTLSLYIGDKELSFGTTLMSVKSLQIDLLTTTIQDRNNQTVNFVKISNRRRINFEKEEIDTIIMNNDILDDSIRNFFCRQKLAVLLNISRASETPGVIRGDFMFSTRNFSKEQSHIIQKQFQQTFSDLLENPTGANDATIFTNDILSKISPTRKVEEYLGTSCLHEFFEKAVKTTPNAVALEFFSDIESGPTIYTYSLLSDLSDKVAQTLLRFDLPADEIIPVVMSKCPEMYIAILGVLKSGCAYCPIDSSTPIERVNYIFTDTKAKVVLVNNAVTLDIFESAKEICFLNITEILASNSTLNIDESKDDMSFSKNLAYVLYTSGSTGLPKGVMVDHYSAVHSILLHIQHFPSYTDTKFLQFASLTFDVSIFDMFYTWGQSLTLVSAPKEYLINSLSKLIVKGKVTHLDLTPTVASTVSWIELPSVRVIYCAGETLLQNVVDSVSRCNEILLFNAYGPTEASIVCIFSKIEKGSLVKIIGKPFPTCSIRVISPASGTLVPIGCIGELCVGGPQVARGYLNQKKLTEEKFESIFIDETENSNARMYRTGDLVRLLSDGSIEYIGRNDDQVKLNGLRIELGEVNVVLERVLREIGINVPQVLSMILKHPSWNRDQMVSFIPVGKFRINDEMMSGFEILSLSEDSDISKKFQKCIALTGQHLLPFMIPKFLIPVNFIPLGISGKADRKVVHSDYPDELNSEILNSIRKAIVSISSIDYEFIHSESTIFHLGLDSIAAMRLSSVLLKDHNLTLSSIDIMKNPVIKDMAKLIQESQVSSVDRDSLNLLGKFINDFENTVLPQLQLDSKIIDKIFPCTPLQESFLLQSELSSTENSIAYYSQAVFSLLPNVNIETFKKSWLAVLQRNEILRTRFCHVTHSSGVGFAQVIMKLAKLQWKTVHCNEDVSKEFIMNGKLIDDFIQEKLEFPISFILFESEKETKKLIIVIHHAIYDGWSWSLILEEILEVYWGLINNNSKSDETFNERPQFSSFSRQIFQKNFDEEFKVSEKKFWSDKLNGIDHIRSFPDLSRSTEQRFKSHTVEINSSLPLSEIEMMASKNGVSLRAISQSAWAFLLSKYLGTSDIVFGQVLSGRTITGLDNIENIVGPCLNTIPCRVIIDENQTIKSLVDIIQNDYISCLPYQQTSLREIKKFISMPVKDSVAFDTMFVFQKAVESKKTIPKIWSTVENFDEDEFSVSIEIEPISDTNTLVLRANCKNSKSNRDESFYLLKQLNSIFIHFLSSFSDRICFTLDKIERNLISFLPPSRPFETDAKFMHDYVTLANQTDQSSVAVHFVSEISKSGEVFGSQLTFSELDTLSSKIANFLIELGICIESKVVLCSEKSLIWYPTLVGISKAGGTYIPIDFEAPNERKLFILQDVGADFVITNVNLAKSFSNIVSGMKIICLDTSEFSMNVDSQSEESPIIPLKQNNIAYILYTSGTTGHPKGVLVEHFNLTQSIEAHRSLIPYSKNSRFLQFASCSFDVSLFEIFFPWSAKMCVCSAPTDVLLRNLEMAFTALNISHAELTPSVATLVRRKRVPGVVVLLTGGEVLTQQVLNEWADGGILYNAYGPTEATIGCTMLCGVNKHSKPSNIGKAFPNAFSLVISNDSHQKRLVMRGTIGELCIGGPLVTRGYHSRDELTAEKFIEWEDVSCDRIYRTGDLVRLMADDTFEFLGRIDEQVKINGIRIELDEISNILMQSSTPMFSSITTCYIGHPDLSKKILVSFAVSNNTIVSNDRRECVILFMKEDFEKLSILSFISKRKLPSYMNPTFIIPIDRLPLGITGKSDVKKLSLLFAETPLSIFYSLQKVEEKIIPFSEWTELEKLLHGVIVSHSKLPSEIISLNSTIYELGLDSLGVVSLCWSLRKLGHLVDVSEVMQNPSISEMSVLLSKKVATGKNELNLQKEFDEFEKYSIGIITKLQQDPYNLTDIESVYPCLPLQEGMIAVSMHSHQELYLNQMVLELLNWVDVVILQEAWSKIVSHFEILRTGFFATEYGYSQVVFSKTESKLCFENISDSDDANRIASKEKKFVFAALSNIKPPIHASIWNRANGKREFHISIHHGLYDGFSLPLILDAIRVQYHLGILPTRPSFQNFVRNFHNNHNEDVKSFWNKELKFASRNRFPTLLRTKQKSPIAVSATKILSISPAVFEKARKVFGATSQSLMQATWAKILFHYLGDLDVTFGLVISGRAVAFPDVENLVAPCFNILPFRVQLSNDVKCNMDLASCVQITNSRILAHQQTPLKDIQKWCKASRDDPIFDTVLIYHHAIHNQQYPEIPELWSKEADGELEIEYPLSVEIEPKEDELIVRIIASSNLLSENQVILLSEQFNVVFNDFINNPYTVDIPLNSMKIDSWSILNCQHETILPNLIEYIHKYGSKWSNQFMKWSKNYLHNIQVLSLTDNSSIALKGGLGEMHFKRLGSFESDIFRTGDLIRIHVDNTIEFVCRKSTQTKINGHRVNLEEIDKSLRFHEEVSDSITIAIDKMKECKDQIIISFITLKYSTSDNPSKIQLLDAALNSKTLQSLKKVLNNGFPIYMVPKLILLVNILPRDELNNVMVHLLKDLYKSLSEKNLKMIENFSVESTAKWSDLEITIFQVLMETLNLVSVDIARQTSFLQLGLDSINAVRFSANMRDAGVDVLVSDLLRYPTISSLSDYLIKTMPGKINEKHVANRCNSDFSSLFSEEWKNQKEFQFSPTDRVLAIYPCTPLQEGMLLETMDSKNKNYLNHFLFELHEFVNTDQLISAFSNVMKLNDIFRTSFHISTKSSQFIQVVHSEVWMSVQKFTLLRDGDLNSKFENYIDSLEDGFGGNHPLISFAIFSGLSKTWLSLSIHHAHYDGWSFTRALNDVRSAYMGNELNSGLRFQNFVDFVLSVDVHAAKLYWSKILKNFIPAPFPTNIHGKILVNNETHYIERRSKLSYKEFVHACRKMEVSEQSVGQAAWSLILSLYSGEKVVTFGHVISGRSGEFEDVQNIVGPTFNTLPCIVQIEKYTKNIDLIRDIHSANIDSLKYQYTPLSLISKLIPEPFAGQHLFDTIYIFQKGTEDVEHESLWNEIQGHSKATHSVSVEVEPFGDILKLRFSCKSSIMSTEQLELLLHQFDIYFENIIRQPFNSPFNTVIQKEYLSIIPMSSDQKILNSSELLFDAFENHAKLSQSKVALEFYSDFNTEPLKMTYEILNQKSNQVAHFLINKGITVDDKIPISLERSPWIYIVILGILKAGAAYVPVDPEMPLERKKYIFQQVDATLAFVNEKLIEIFWTDIEFICLTLENIDTLFIEQPSMNPNVSIKPTSLAYVLFTSGTTGVPKGVLIEHKSVVCAMKVFQSKIFATNDSRMLQFATFTFDVSIFEIFYSWTVGMTLCTAPKDILLDDITVALNFMKISHADLTPTMAALIDSSLVETLNTLITGGESLTLQVLNSWSGKLINAYGPTETTIGCTMNCRVESNTKTSNIGQVFESCSAFVVDSNLKVLPKGVIGELCVGGPQVAREYLKSPDLTLKNFIDISIPEINVLERVYRTGDFVRMLANNELEFIGRHDDQIKLNGLRIELGEINAVMLKSDKQIQEVISLVLRNPHQQCDQLVSFIKIVENSESFCKILPLSDVARHAWSSTQEQLPPYMVPGHVFEVSKIPTGVNGKADRKILFKLFAEQNLANLENPEKLNEIWTDIDSAVIEVLSAVSAVPPEKISLSTSIFQIGLDSITAIQIASKLKKKGLGIAVSEIMRAQTVSRISAVIKNLQLNYESNSKNIALETLKDFNEKFHGKICLVLNVNPSEILHVYPCTPLQEGMIFESVKSGGKMYFNDISFELFPSTDIDRLIKSWKFIVSRTEILRTGFCPTPDDKGNFGVSQCVFRNFEISVSETTESNSQKVSTILNDQEGVWKRLCRPPIHIAVTQHKSKKNLVLSIHHALYDGWSLPLILRDVQFAYNSWNLDFRPQFSSILPGIINYNVQARNYWKAEMKDCSPCVFPNLHGRISSFHEINYKASLIVPMSISELKYKCRSLSIPIQTVFLTAYAIILEMYTGDSNVIFGQVVSGRGLSNVEDIEKVIGPTFNTIPCRFSTRSNNETNLEVMIRMREQIAKASSFQQFPLREILKFVSFKEAELFDTLFLYQMANSDEVSELWKIQDNNESGINSALVIEVSPSDVQVELHGSCQSKLMPESHLQLLLTQISDLVIHLLLHPDQSAGSVSFSKTSQSVISRTRLVSEVSEPHFLHQCIERNAIENPEKIALEFSWDIFGRNIELHSFASINTKANQLARFLKSLGAKENMLIPLIVHRSVWMYIAILAILKAGCAWVPIDREIPFERIYFICQDMEAKIILTDNEEFTLGNSNVILLNTKLTLKMESFETSNLNVQMSNLHTAYVIYTSGTTGIPKGVVISHRAAVETFKSFLSLIPHTRDSRFLQFASHTFDVSIFETFYAWSAGITLVTAPKDIMLTYLEETITTLKVTHADLTPTVLALLDPTIVKFDVLVTGGEMLTQQMIDRWSESCVMFNAYGPTEATIGCSLAQVFSKIKPANIGFPFPSCSVYIVDKFGIVPKGGVGELCVGGPQLANGYIKQPELTDCKFTSIDGVTEKVYRTGDFVRMLVDGSLLYISRQDDQVKLNGLRIELEEITSVLNVGDSSIRELVTIVSKRQGSQRDQIFSFVCLESENRNEKLNNQCMIMISPDSDKISEKLMILCQQKLPYYMIPSFIFIINFIPMGVTGKCNKKLLSRLLNEFDFSKIQHDTTLKPSSFTNLELKIRQCLSAISQVPENEIYRNTSIYELGLDSISCMKVTSNLSCIGINVSVSEVMKYSCIAALSSHISSRSQLASDVERAMNLYNSCLENLKKFSKNIPGLQTSEIQGIYPCTPLQEGMIVESLLSNGSSYINHVALKLDKGTDIPSILKAWNVVINANDILRTSFHELPIEIDDFPFGGFIQVVHRNFQICVDYLEFSSDKEFIDKYKEYIENTVKNMTKKNIFEEPPIKLGILKSKSPEYVWLILSIHHALYDGWSLPLIFKDVVKVYSTLNGTTSINLKLRPQFSSILPQILSTKFSPIHQVGAGKYWSKFLVNNISKPFPIMKTKNTNTNTTHFTVECEIKSLKLQDIRNSGSKLNVSIQSFAQSTLGILLSLYTGTQDALFGRVISGRNVSHSEFNTEDAILIIGPTFNTVPCRVQFDYNGKNSDLVSNVHKWNVEGIPWESVALGDALKWGKCDRNLINCLFLYQIREDEDEHDDDLPSLIWSIVDGQAEVNYPLAIEVLPSSKFFRLTATCSSELMSLKQLEALISQFELILEELIQNPYGYISFDLSPKWISRMNLFSINELNHNLPERFLELRNNFEANDKVYVVSNKGGIVLRGAVGRLCFSFDEPKFGYSELVRIKSGYKNDFGAFEIQEIEVYMTKLYVRMIFDGSIEYIEEIFVNSETRSSNIHTMVENEWSEVELEIRDVLADIGKIKKETIQRNMTIFELGLDSISAIRCASKLRGRKINISVAQILKSQTIEKMCIVLNHQIIEPNSQVKSIVAVDIKNNALNNLQLDEENISGIYRCTPGQEYTITHWSDTKGQEFVHTFVFNSKDRLNLEKLLSAWKKVVLGNPILRTVFAGTNLKHAPLVQVILSQTYYEKTYPEFGWSENQYATPLSDNIVLSHVYEEKMRKPSDLGGKPPFSIHCINFSNSTVILISLHHALYDGWSMTLLLEEICQEYEGNVEIKTIDDKDHPWTQFLNFLSNLSEDKQKNLWKSMCGELIQTKFSPTKLIPDIPQSRQTNMFVPKALLNSGEILARLYANLYRTLHPNIDPTQVIVGIYHHGRTLPFIGIENLVAPCVNMLPIVVKASEDVSEIIDAAKSVLTSLSKMNEVGLGYLKSYQEDGSVCDTWINFMVNTDKIQSKPHKNLLNVYSSNELVLNVVDSELERDPIKRIEFKPIALQSVLPKIEIRLDIEIAIRNDAIDIGIFCSGEIMSENQANWFIDQICKITLKSLDFD
ncbi:hypothetical protein HK096_004825 [Nowakowskiella sp. JEL0078]|nr:hypothetical protein HK096_004825 [Nowakowskiella sp. JEL0078]